MQISGSPKSLTVRWALATWRAACRFAGEALGTEADCIQQEHAAAAPTVAAEEGRPAESAAAAPEVRTEVAAAAAAAAAVEGMPAYRTLHWM